MVRIYHFYNDYHYGDNILNLKFLNILSSFLETNNIRIYYYYNHYYIKRIKELESLALSYDGVTSAYAIQAGRELRVLVEAEKVTDQRSEELSFTISQRIQTEMTYPGQVKVTVIREKRSINYAK